MADVSIQPHSQPATSSGSDVPHNAHGSRDRSHREYEQTIPYARQALERIVSLHLPADPASFELWYTYASEHNADLKNAIDGLTQQGSISIDQLDAIHEQFVLSRRGERQLAILGEKLNIQIERILGLADDSISSATKYSKRLAGIVGMARAIGDLEALRDLVQALVTATHEVELQNHHLARSLTESRVEIDTLRGQLEDAKAHGSTDALTNLSNRQSFDAALAQAITERQKRYSSFALLMCDIDNFKKFNDSYGHLIGDDILRLVGATLRNHVRRGDVAARYGGDELALILWNTNLPHAIEIAEELRQAVSARELTRRSTKESMGRITISVGIAAYRMGDSVGSIIERADAALYWAKARGRNRVMSETNQEAAEVRLHV